MVSGMGRIALLVVLGCCCTLDAVSAQPLPDLTETASAWQPVEPTPKVEMAEGGERLRFRCNFAETTEPRVSWDRAVALDLSGALGMVFTSQCDDPMPVSRFSFYLHTASGWYSAGFAPEGTGGKPERMFIPRMAMRTEGAPGGWRRIDRIRISAWRGSDKDTTFLLSDFAVIPATPGVAVLQAQRSVSAEPGEARTVLETARRVASYLEANGIPHAPLSDVDMAEAMPAGHRLIIVPYCPSMDERTEAALLRFIADGGKVITFYAIPPKLARALGMTRGRHMQSGPGARFASIRPAADGGVMGLPDEVRQHSWNIIAMEPVADKARVAAWWHDGTGRATGEAAVLVSGTGAHMTHILLDDDRENQARLLLAMVGALYPEAWPMAARHAVSALDTLAQALASPPPATATVDARVAAGDYPGALRAAGAIRQSMLEAYYRRQRPEAGEFRGFWCHSPFGVEGMTWDEAVRLLAENGFTALFPNMAWGGVAYYESDVLPVAPEVAERGDQLAECLAACKKYGIELHYWKVCWNMTGHAPKAFRERMKKTGRTQVRFDGGEEANWLCPCREDNRALETAAMLEVAERYDVDGLHFDYIRYPDEDASFSEACRQGFEARLGHSVSPWPAAMREDPKLRRAWGDFRRDQITRVVAGVHKAVKERHLKVKVSAAVFITWPTHRDTVGQDWKAWCDAGYLDFVCPMDYTERTGQFDTWIRQQQAWAGEVPVYPGIGLGLWTGRDPMLTFIEQVKRTRQRHTGGFMVFNYGVREARSVVPWCGAGLLRDTVDTAHGAR